MAEPLGADDQIAGRQAPAAAPGAPASHPNSDPHDHGGHASAGERVRDPVCGMTVDPQTTAHRQAFAGRTDYFCSAGGGACLAAEPRKDLEPETGRPPATPV